MKTHGIPAKGFTLIEIMIVVALIGLLGAIAVPNIIKARETSQTNACIHNLRQIDCAKQQWALEKGTGVGVLPDPADIRPYVGRGDVGSLDRVSCPLVTPPTPLAGYSINNVGALPQCKNVSEKHQALLP